MDTHITKNSMYLFSNENKLIFRNEMLNLTLKLVLKFELMKSVKKLRKKATSFDLIRFINLYLIFKFIFSFIRKLKTRFKKFDNFKCFSINLVTRKSNFLFEFILIWMLNINLVSTNNEFNCFGGIETFEKTSMVFYDNEIKSAGTLLQHTDQALTRDCINECKNQPICISFSLDYTNFVCTAYQFSSSQLITDDYLYRHKLLASNKTNYFEKVCFKGMNKDDYQQICGLERLWAFERVLDAFLDGYEDLSYSSIASKEDCAKMCLIETKFSCRSADYDHVQKVCRLSREDRRTQPQAFRQVYGSKRDYLENNCAFPGPTTCLYDTKRNTNVITMDSLVFADNLQDCQQKCDKETSFNCRAFSLNGKKCYLSADDSVSLANSKPNFKQNYMYGEKHCVTEHCSNGVFTYEKITGHVLRTAITTPMQINLDTFNIGITGNCKRYCDANPLSCPAFQVNYLSSRCDYLDRNSQSRQLELIERDGENYFEKICLRIPQLMNSACRDKFWTFERILGYELGHLHYERVYEQVLSRRDCEEYCLLEKSFNCRSALYNDESAVCKLSRYDRRVRSSDFIRNNNYKVSYLENQCVTSHSICEYENTPNAYPTYTDLVVNFTGLYDYKEEKQGKLLCENRCNESREFLCRSYAFYVSTNECFLSGDDTISGYLSAISSRNAMNYSERKCSKKSEIDANFNDLNDQTEARSNGNLENFSLDSLPQLNERTENSNTYNTSSASTISDARLSSNPNSQTPYSLSHYTTSSLTNPQSSQEIIKQSTLSLNQLKDFKNNLKDQTQKQIFTDSINRDDEALSSKETFQPTTESIRSFSSSLYTTSTSKTLSNLNTDSRTTFKPNTSKKWLFNTSNSFANNTMKFSYSDRFTTYKPSFQAKKCPQGSEFTFERIPNFEPIGGQLFFLHSDIKSSAIALDCLMLCRSNPNCTGFVLDYVQHFCHGIYQVYTISKLDLRLTPGKDFFEGICLEDKVKQNCIKSWIFDRIIDQTIVKSLQIQPRLILNYIDKLSCKTACLNEVRFKCRSVTYDLTSRECRLYDENRDSGEIQLQFTRGTEYIENQCNFYEPNMCKYNLIERDLTITSVIKSVPGHSTYYCEQLCNSEQDFNCRSYTYLDQTMITHGNLCFLNADSRYTSLSGSVKFRPRALYAEKDCMDNTIQRKERDKMNNNMLSNNFEDEKINSQINKPIIDLPNQMETKNQDYEEPAIELPNFVENKNRACDYTEFTYEKTFGKQLKQARRERILANGNLFSPIKSKRFKRNQNSSTFLNTNKLDEILVESNFIDTYKNENHTKNHRLKRNSQVVSPTENMSLISLTSQCQDECTRRSSCRSFIIEHSNNIGGEQCFLLEEAANEQRDILEDLKTGSYFEKICLREKHCNKLWTFDRVISFNLDMPAKRIFQTNTRLDCEDVCLAEEKFACKSATYNYETKICRLFNENRRTKPNVFKATTHQMDYFENQCVKEPTTCQYKDQLNSELPIVDKLIHSWNLDECKQYCNSERLFNCKSVNFDTFKRECTLSSDELTNINIINSVKYAPMTLSTQLNSIYSEKGSCEHISVQCNNENMLLLLNFDSAFFGRIYSKANPSQCYLNGNGENHLEFPIPLNPICGTKQEGSHYFVNEVIIQQHSVIMTDSDKTIKVLCSFEQMDQTITLQKNNKINGLDVKSFLNARLNENDQTSSLIINTMAPPTIMMKILDKTGNEANYVNLGDELMLKIEIKDKQPHNSFEIFARNLYAKSSNNETLHLLDSNGCPLDATVFPQMEIDQNDQLSLISKFKAFRFPSTGVVNFEVQIKFCPNKCDNINCNLIGSSLVDLNENDKKMIKTNLDRQKRQPKKNEFYEDLIAIDPSLHKTNSSLSNDEDLKNKTQIELKDSNESNEFKDFTLDKFPFYKDLEEKVINFNIKDNKKSINKNFSENNRSYIENTPHASQLMMNSNFNNHNNIGSGILYPINNDPNSYTIPYQMKLPYSNQNNHYSGNGYSYSIPFSIQDTNSFLNKNSLSNLNLKKTNPFESYSQNSPNSNNYWITQNQNTLNEAEKKKFVPPRPLKRKDGQPVVPKIVQAGFPDDQEYPLSLAILVNEKKKELSKKQTIDKRKINLPNAKIDKKNKEKENNYQMQYLEKCKIGPVILYTSILITVIYLIVGLIIYFYYKNYIKYYENKKLLFSFPLKNDHLNAPKNTLNCDNFNFNFPPIHRTNKLHLFENRLNNTASSLFKGNLNGTIRSLNSSTMSKYHSLFTQQFHSKLNQTKIQDETCQTTNNCQNRNVNLSTHQTFNDNSDNLEMSSQAIKTIPKTINKKVLIPENGY